MLLCLVSVESSVYFPASYLVVPFLVAAQETYRGIYIVNHIVGHDAPNLHQVNRVCYPVGDLFLIQNILEEANRASAHFQLKILFYSTAILYPLVSF